METEEIIESFVDEIIHDIFDIIHIKTIEKLGIGKREQYWNKKKDSFRKESFQLGSEFIKTIFFHLKRIENPLFILMNSLPERKKTLDYLGKNYKKEKNDLSKTIKEELRTFIILHCSR
ncbi:MAG TPA: hypothetical protein PKC14_01805 [Candidatus Absconditabacterales bacterium]|nr:hypothetical protein [Candidatus Absconditabacterales bacterium]